MRGAFPGWYKPTQDEVEALWDQGIIALDANALLAPYRLAMPARRFLFNVVEAYREQIWVPHRAGLEYQRSRLNVVAEQRKTYSDIESALASAETELLKRRSDHPVLDPVEYKNVVRRALQGVGRWVSEAEKSHPNVLGSDRDEDVVRDQWDALLEGRVGHCLAIDDAWIAAADKRYAQKIPPGYEDDHKRPEGHRLYGDLILWYELLSHVKERSLEEKRKIPVLLVTNDKKEDWWRISDTQLLGPRPELVDEIAAHGGAPFWAYTVSDFIDAGAGHLGWELDREVAAEVAAVGGGSEADLRDANDSGADELTASADSESTDVTKDGALEDAPSGAAGDFEEKNR